MHSKTHKALTILALAGSLGAVPAMADHNSVWGSGWANMPNDIHNTRIEDDLSSEEWTDFVQYGEGADVDNRYLDSSTSTTTTTTTRGGSRR